MMSAASIDSAIFHNYHFGEMQCGQILGLVGPLKIECQRYRNLTSLIRPDQITEEELRQYFLYNKNKGSN